MDQNILYAMAFSKVSGLGAKTLFKFHEQILRLNNKDDAYLLLEELCEKNKRIQHISKKQFLPIVQKMETIMETHEKNNIIAVSALDKEYPRSFLVLKLPPVYFFAKGNLNALQMPGVAIIGTRKVSNFARKVGEHLGKYVASKGWTVISGLAEGCDTAGHVGCIQAKAVTIAIVGTPLDQVYPKSNARLQDEILSCNGCVISEYPIGAAVTPYNFIDRDRLQCGLAKGVIVVETGLKGGSYHAINGAVELHKPVACFQFNPKYYSENMQSLGNQKMISDKTAVPIYDGPSIDAFLESCKEKKAVQTESGIQEISLF